MTDLHYRYVSETRTLQDRSKRYAGQQCDSGSTTLHFEYDPLNYIEMHGFQPFLVFNVNGPDGGPMVYGRNSQSRFDGYRFDLPWDLTSRVKDARVEFQLWLVNPNIVIDDETQVPSLESTDYELSSITGFALKPSIMRKKKGCNPLCPPDPTTEPTLMGLMQVFMEYGVLRPIKSEKDEKNHCYNLYFRSYYGGEDVVTLEVPFLNDGKVDPIFLPFIQSWFDGDGNFLATETSIPSGRFMYEALNGKTDTVMAVPQWDPEQSYFFGSAVIGVNGAMYVSIADGNLNQDPQEGLFWVKVMDSRDLGEGEGQIATVEWVLRRLAEKYDWTNVINEWNDVPSTIQVPSEALIVSRLDTMTEGFIEDEWLDPLPTDQGASQRLIQEALDAKTDKSMAIPEWDEDTTYDYMASVVYEGQIYLSRLGSNTGNIPILEDLWWMPLGVGIGSGSGCCTCNGLYTAFVGDGENTSFTVTHGLGSENVLVELRDAFTRQYVRSTVQVVDENTLRVSFRNPPAADGIVVMVTDTLCNSNTIVETLGNGVDREFTVTHNWGTYNVFSQLRMNDGTGLLVFADVAAVNPAQVRVSFARPPDPDSIVFYLTPCVSDCTFDHYVHTQTTAADEWVINHNLNRVVAVYTMTLDGEEMSAYVRQDMTSLNSVTVQFSEPVTGVAYIR